MEDEVKNESALTSALATPLSGRKPRTAKPAEEDPAPAASHSITLDMAALGSLITTAVSAAVSQQSKSSAEILAEALNNLRKPFETDAEKQNKADASEASKKMRQRLDAAIERDRDSCPHKQGCNPLSEFQGPLSSFVLHRLDTGEVIGICTNCQKIISSLNPADRAFFSVKSANKMSSAGVRSFANPMEAMQARHGK